MLATWFFTYGLMQIYKYKGGFVAVFLFPVIGAPILVLLIGIFSEITGRLHVGVFELMAGAAIVIGLVAAYNSDGAESKENI